MNQFEQDIKDKLIRLSEKKRILFALLIVDKLYPHYVAFQEKYNWGDSALLFDAIGLVYQYIIDDSSVFNLEIENTIAKIDEIIPDIDDFGSALSSFALNASISIQNALKYLVDKNIDDITDIVSLTLDTLDLFIQDKEDFDTLDPSRDIQIEHDSYMVQEQMRELEIIDKLSMLQTNLITKEVVESFRNETSIIDLSLLSDCP